VSWRSAARPALHRATRSALTLPLALLRAVTDQTCLFLFVIEFGIRLASALYVHKWPMFRDDPMNWVDVIAIVPFYLAQLDVPVADETRFARLLRLGRLLRVIAFMKGMRYNDSAEILSDIVGQSLGAMVIPLFFMLLAMIVYGAAIYNLEAGKYVCDGLTNAKGDGPRYTYDTESYGIHAAQVVGCDTCEADYVSGGNGIVPRAVSCPIRCTWTGPGCPRFTYDGAQASDGFETIPTSFWWTIVTFTTVGYGDKFPMTTWGRFLAMFTMFQGLFFISMPVAIVGDSFEAAFIKAQDKSDRKVVLEEFLEFELEDHNRAVAKRLRLKSLHLTLSSLMMALDRKVLTWRDKRPTDTEEFLWDEAERVLMAFYAKHERMWSIFPIDELPLPPEGLEEHFADGHHGYDHSKLQFVDMDEVTLESNPLFDGATSPNAMDSFETEQ